VLRVVTERLEVWPRNGTLGLLGTPCLRSTPKDELLRDAESKWPDLFSRRDACKDRPESVREADVDGIGGKLLEVGEVSRGEGGDPVFDVELVLGRSYPLEYPLETAGSFPACRKALKMSGFDAAKAAES